MKSKFILAASLCVSCWNLNAQSVSYKTVMDDPNEVRDFKMYLQFLTMEGIALGGGVGAAYSPVDRLHFESIFRMTYWDPLGPSKDAIVNDASKSFKPYFEGGLNFYYKKKVKEEKGKAKITLSGGYNYEKFMVVRCNKRRMLGLRGGVMYYNNVININDKNEMLMSKDGTLVTPPLGSFFAVQSNTFGTYFGLSTRKTKHVLVDVDMFGRRRWFSDTYLFLDAIVGATSLSDVVYNGQIYDTGGTERGNLGFRFGAQIDQKNIVTRMEFGVKPNVALIPKFGMPYFLFSFAATIVGSEKGRAPK